MLNRLAMIWTGKPFSQPFQEFVEEGVAYFEKKHGYKPVLIEYRVEDGVVNIPGIECVACSSNVQRKVVLLYEREEVKITE